MKNLTVICRRCRYYVVLALGLLIVIPLCFSLGQVSSFVNISPLSINATNQIAWSSLRGVDYLTWNLGIEGPSQDPSVAFPIMKADGINLIRVPISWGYSLSVGNGAGAGNPTNYFNTLNAVANAADANGISVIYDFHAGSGSAYNTKQAFPGDMLAAYTSSGTLDLNAFYTAWFANQITYNGQTAWKAMASEFWVPLIQAVDSHQSTLGYETINEPSYGLTNGAASLQAYNQFVYNTIRGAGSSKAVVFCAKDGTDPSAADMKASAPTGTNIVFDIHYSTTDANVWASLTNTANSMGLAGIWLGEWFNYSATVSQLVTYISFFKSYGVAMTWWAWACRTGMLLDTNCLPTPALSNLAQAINQVYGNVGTTSSSTISSKSSSSSTDTSSSISTTSSSYSSTIISSSTTIFATTHSSSSSTSISSSSSVSSTSSSNLQTTGIAQDSSSSSTRTNATSSFTTITSRQSSFIATSQSQAAVALSPPSSPAASDKTALKYSFAGYEIALIGGLPLIFESVRKNQNDAVKIARNWRW